MVSLWAWAGPSEEKARLAMLRTDGSFVLDVETEADWSCGSPLVYFLSLHSVKILPFSESGRPTL